MASSSSYMPPKKRVRSTPPNVISFGKTGGSYFNFLKRDGKVVLGPDGVTGLGKNLKGTDQGLIDRTINSKFINGVNILSFEIGPWRHCVVFYWDTVNNKVILSDWKMPVYSGSGKSRIQVPAIDAVMSSMDYSHYEGSSSQDYLNIFRAIESKTKISIEIAPLDMELRAQSDSKAGIQSGGGCSEYAYSYAQKHYAI